MRRRHVLAGLALAPFVGGLANVRAEPTEDLVGPILQQSGAPGLAGAVFDAEGTLFLGAAGVRQAGGTRAVTSGDLWHLGSNTKAMTALLYERLVETGRIPAGLTLGAAFDGVTVDPALAGRTPEELMTHRLGLSDEGLFNPAWILAARADTRPLTVQRAELAANLLGRAPPQPAGAFLYANVNFVLLGALIEHQTGAAWEDLMRTELFGSLGMASAGFGAPTGDQPWGHSGVLPLDPAGIADNPPVVGPAGTVHASLEDYGKFVRLFLNEGGGYVKAETIARILTDDGVRDPEYRMGWGVFRDQDWAKGPELSHAGSNTFWFALAAVAPARRLAIVAVSNDADRGAGACRALVSALVKRFAV